jgi:alanine racemase
VTESMREAKIYPGAISHNVNALHKIAGSPLAMLVVKADGYGHGMRTAARAGLEGGATWLGTADIDEALALRKDGITAPVLAWLVGPDSAVASAIEAGVDLGVSGVGQLEQIAQHSTNSRPATIHIKVDSGMGRGGVEEARWGQVFDRAAELQRSGHVVVRGLFTHFAQTSAESDRDQAQVFARAREALNQTGVVPEVVHTSSSTPSARTPELAQDVVRLGISAYGVSVVAEHEPAKLRAAMRLAGQVIQVKSLPAGHGVGYDHTYRTTSATQMALIPLGYADGVPRSASSKGPVTLAGRRFTVAGRVSMDQISVDVGDAPITRGDWAVLFGDPDVGEPSVKEWADAAGTISYEILTGIGPRVRRVVA